MIELRWCIKLDGKITPQQKPTATDAIEYANERLIDDEEFICSSMDIRLGNCERVKTLLSIK